MTAFWRRLVPPIPWDGASTFQVVVLRGDIKTDDNLAVVWSQYCRVLPLEVALDT